MSEQDPESVTSEDPEKHAMASEAKSLDAKTTYEVIRQEGMDELDRPTIALAWSGLAAGLSMGFSFLAQGLLRSHLPDTEWRPLIVNLGYTVGFLIVIVGSQQLFTENTLTPIVPLLHRWSGGRLRNVLRLWGAVLAANLVGAFVFGLAAARLQIVESGTLQAMSAIAHESLRYGAVATMLHGVYAGWLIALMVWMLPGAETSKPLVIIVMTYLVGLGGFAHIIVGAVEVMYMVVRGEVAIADAAVRYLVPTFVGNVAGGVTLVAALNYAQAQTGE
jgi:formate/nitrite transporter FocA (FNT family)